jgi:hypothetical protein
VTFKGVDALRSEGGSQETYGETSDGLALRSKALEGLDRFSMSAAATSPDFSNNLRRTVEHLKRGDKKQTKRLGKFEKSQGSTATVSKRRVIQRKLQWAFGGEQDFREYDAQAGPGRDRPIRIREPRPRHPTRKTYIPIHLLHYFRLHIFPQLFPAPQSFTNIDGHS